MKKVLIGILAIFLIVALAGVIKFNFSNDDIYVANEVGEFVQIDSLDSVGIYLDKDMYTSDEKLLVTVKNNLEETVSVRNMQGAFCSILGLERENDMSWENSWNCASRAVEIGQMVSAGETLKLELPTDLRHTVLGIWSYRFFLDYSVWDQYTYDMASRVYSQEFKVVE